MQTNKLLILIYLCINLYGELSDIGYSSTQVICISYWYENTFKLAAIKFAVHFKTSQMLTFNVMVSSFSTKLHSKYNYALP